ncbi:MAG: carboxypeptidase-like regulatory domain-containing protein [Pyrinomonadaceae bacterium]|nr:carboxypeptidase-like regulatory domain-containing protein [Pyrinomonadaceae bacterium]
MLGLTIFVNAQNIEKSVVLSGRIYDSTGWMMSDVKITVTNKQKEKIQVTTDSEGIYQLKLLPGIHKIVIESAKFKKVVLKKFKVEQTVDSKMNQDFVLGDSVTVN